MGKKLLYGPHQFRLSDDEDLSALALRIDECLKSGGPTWLAVNLVRGGTANILVAPGASIALAVIPPDTDKFHSF